MDKIWVYVLLIVVGFTGAIVDWGINQWLETRVKGWWIVVVLGSCANIALFLTILSLDHFSFGIAVVASLVTHCLVGVVLDHICYGEKYGTAVWAGIFLGMVAIALMDIGQREDKAKTVQVVSSEEHPTD